MYLILLSLNQTVMKKLYALIYLNRCFKFNWFISLVLFLFALSAQGQSLVNTFTYGNGNLGQIPLYRCEGNLQLNMTYNVQSPDAIVFVFPQ